MTDTTVISITAQQRIAVKPYILATKYVRPTLRANGVPNTLFLAFLFSEHDVAFSSSVTFGYVRLRFVTLLSIRLRFAFLSFHCLALRYVHGSSRNLCVLPHFRLTPHLPFILVLKPHISPPPSNSFHLFSADITACVVCFNT